MNKFLVKNEEMEAKRVFQKLGWAILAMTAGVMFLGSFVAGVISGISPEFAAGPWFNWVNVGISFYCIGFPIFYFMTKDIPDGPKGEEKKMSFKEFMVVFMISMAAVYIFNIVGNLVNMIIGLIVGGEIANPLIGAIEGASVLATLIFVGILSPIVEEVIFRGIMLNKLRAYGDKTAICFTSLIFGLFHGNLSQFFYALVLGLFLGYIASKTNTIKYTVLLHVAINMIGSVIMPAIISTEIEILIGIVGIALITIIVGGIILYAQNIKKIELDPAQIEIEAKVKKRMLYFNIGIILYYAMCASMFINAIVASVNFKGK